MYQPWQGTQWGVNQTDMSAQYPSFIPPNTAQMPPTWQTPSVAAYGQYSLPQTVTDHWRWNGTQWEPTQQYSTPVVPVAPVPPVAPVAPVAPVPPIASVAPVASVAQVITTNPPAPPTSVPAPVIQDTLKYPPPLPDPNIVQPVQAVPTSSELAPKDPNELEKFNQLKVQAQQWHAHQTQVVQQWPYQNTQPANSWQQGTWQQPSLWPQQNTWYQATAQPPPPPPPLPPTTVQWPNTWEQTVPPPNPPLPKEEVPQPPPPIEKDLVDAVNALAAVNKIIPLEKPPPPPPPPPEEEQPATQKQTENELTETSSVQPATDPQQQQPPQTWNVQQNQPLQQTSDIDAASKAPPIQQMQQAEGETATNVESQQQQVQSTEPAHDQPQQQRQHQQQWQHPPPPILPEQTNQTVSTWPATLQTPESQNQNVPSWPGTMQNPEPQNQSVPAWQGNTQNAEQQNQSIPNWPGGIQHPNPPNQNMQSWSGGMQNPEPPNQNMQNWSGGTQNQEPSNQNMQNWSGGLQNQEPSNQNMQNWPESMKGQEPPNQNMQNWQGGMQNQEPPNQNVQNWQGGIQNQEPPNQNMQNWQGNIQNRNAAEPMEHNQYNRNEEWHQQQDKGISHQFPPAQEEQGHQKVPPMNFPQLPNVRFPPPQDQWQGGRGQRPVIPSLLDQDVQPPRTWQPNQGLQKPPFPLLNEPPPNFQKNWQENQRPGFQSRSQEDHGQDKGNTWEENQGFDQQPHQFDEKGNSHRWEENKGPSQRGPGALHEPSLGLLDAKRGSFLEQKRGSLQDSPSGPPHNLQRGLLRDPEQGLLREPLLRPPNDSQRGLSHDQPRGLLQDPQRGSLHDQQRGLLQDPQRGSFLNSQRAPLRGQPHDPQRGPLLEPHRMPLLDSHRGPLLDHQRGPLLDSQRGPLLDPIQETQRGPKRGWQQGPGSRPPLLKGQQKGVDKPWQHNVDEEPPIHEWPDSQEELQERGEPKMQPEKRSYKRWSDKSQGPPGMAERSYDWDSQYGEFGRSGMKREWQGNSRSRPRSQNQYDDDNERWKPQDKRFPDEQWQRQQPNRFGEAPSKPFGDKSWQNRPSEPAGDIDTSNISIATLEREEQEFEMQFSQWEKQFEIWKKQNKDHPDRSGFGRYEKQWREWRERLLRRRDQMRSLRAQRQLLQERMNSDVSASREQRDSVEPSQNWPEQEKGESKPPPEVSKKEDNEQEEEKAPFSGNKPAQGGELASRLFALAGSDESSKEVVVQDKPDKPDKPPDKADKPDTETDEKDKNSDSGKQQDSDTKKLPSKENQGGGIPETDIPDRDSSKSYVRDRDIPMIGVPGSDVSKHNNDRDTTDRVLGKGTSVQDFFHRGNLAKVIPGLGTSERGLLGRGIPERDRDISERSIPFIGVTERGFPDRSIPDRIIQEGLIHERGIRDKDIQERGILDRAIPERGLRDRGMLERGIPDRGILEKHIPDRDICERGMPDRGMLERGILNRGILERGIPEIGISDRGMSEVSILDRGISEREIIDRNIPERDILGRNLGERGRGLRDRGRGVGGRGLGDRGRGRKGRRGRGRGIDITDDPDNPNMIELGSGGLAGNQRFEDYGDRFSRHDWNQPIERESSLLGQFEPGYHPGFDNMPPMDDLQLRGFEENPVELCAPWQQPDSQDFQLQNFGPEFSGIEPPVKAQVIDYGHRSSISIGDDSIMSKFGHLGGFGSQHDFGDLQGLPPPPSPMLFSQSKVEIINYEHGHKDMQAIIKEGIAKEVFDYEHRREGGDNKERNRESRDLKRDHDWSRDKERDRDNWGRDKDRERDRDRDRGRERDQEKDRERIRDKNKDQDEKVKEKISRRDAVKNSEGRNSPKDVKSVTREEASIDEKSTNKANHDAVISPQVNVGQQFSAQEMFPRSTTKGDTILIKDLLTSPGRFQRPKQLVIILRGPPGSGKSYVAKLIKDKEIENGGSAPRMLSLDDYFMVETEKTVKDPDTGKRVKKKEFEYEYEPEMEEVYHSSLFKSFKKTIDDRFFPFIIVDAINDKVKLFENYWSYAKQRGFQVYIAEMDKSDPAACHKHNIHKRSLEDIKKMINKWESTPRHYLRVDVRSLLQDVSITEVEMEDMIEDNSKSSETKENDNESEETEELPVHVPSRWEQMEATGEKLDQLDGLRVTKRKHSSMEDYLQLPDDYEERQSQPGKKRVRWADIEERKQQDRIRAIGFVVGQTDWQKMTDPTQADKALTRTKYF